MKTISILFSEPNVFSVLPNDFPKGMCVYSDACNSGITCKCEQSKDNAIRIDNQEYAEIQCYMNDRRINGPCNLLFWRENILKSGDIFQVEGFEYEVKTRYVEPPDTIHCNRGWDEKVAILKLAKEDEPKEPDDLHNLIMVQWEKDYGSIHSEQMMDAYTVSGFIRELLKVKNNL